MTPPSGHVTHSATGSAPVAASGAAFALRVPKVPLVSGSPDELLICDAKKLSAGLLGPESVCSAPAFAPKSRLSPPITASPSCADTKSFPLIGSESGVRNPATEMSALPASNETADAPHHRVRLRSGCEESSYTTASVQPAWLVSVDCEEGFAISAGIIPICRAHRLTKRASAPKIKQHPISFRSSAG